MWHACKADLGNRRTPQHVPSSTPMKQTRRAGSELWAARPPQQRSVCFMGVEEGTC